MQINLDKSVFIGLGTTGLKICEQIRSRYESYFGRGGIPEVTEFITIDSVENLSYLKTGNKTVINIGIAGKLGEISKKFNSTKEALDRVGNDNPKDIALKNEVASEDFELSKQLMDWMDPEVLNDVSIFVAGAGHWRQAGRLCVWYALAKGAGNDMRHNIHSNIKAAIESVSFGASHDSERIQERVRRLYGDGTTAVVGNKVHVFILGTLAGGTCSGSFIDIAHLARDGVG
ncbi:MAG: tubulin-like doman-containing protein, partial [bacterium]